MADTIEAILPGDHPTRESLLDLPYQLSGLYLEIRDRLLELDDSRKSAMEEIFSRISDLDGRFQEIEGAVAGIEGAMRAETSARYTFVERFESDLNTQTSTLYREPKGGYLCLQPVEMRNNPGQVRAVRILESLSHGVPGNNMQIERTSAVERNGVRLVDVELVGAEDSRASIAALFDDRPDTLMEWEVNVVQSPQKLRSLDGIQLVASDDGELMDVWKATSGYGWEIVPVYPEQEIIDPGKRVRVARLAEKPDTPPAQLVMEIELAESASGLLDLTAAPSGGMTPTLFLLQASTDGVEWVDLLTPPGRDRLLVRLDGGSPLHQKVTVQVDGYRYLRVGLRSGGWYQPRGGLGHPYAVAIVDEVFERSFFFGAIRDRDHRVLKRRVETEVAVVGSIRVEDPSLGWRLVSAVGASLALTARGVTMTWLTSAIGKAKVAALKALAPVAAFVLGVAVVSGLYSERKTRQLREVATGYDVFRGWRSAISLREMQFLTSRYRSAGEWISRAIRFAQPLKRVALHAEQVVPQGASVKYYISTDMVSWREMTPVQAGGRVLELAQPADTIFLRVEMRSERENVSPLVYSVGLEGFAS